MALISGIWASHCGETIVQAQETDGISGELTVTFNIEEKIMGKYIESFMQKYPDVNVHYECVENYEDVMGDRLESGNYGDVLFVLGFMESMQVPNYFAPLGNYFKMSQKYNYLDSGFKSGNMIYTIPSSGYIMGVAYNKDVFYRAGISRTPTSIDAFLEDMAMIKERTDAVPIYLNSSLDWTLRNWIDFPYAEMTGDADYKGNQFIYEKNPFTEGGTHYEVYKLLYDLEADGYTEGIENDISWPTTCSDLNNGRCACIVMGSWALRQLKDAGKNEDSVAFMPFPNEIDGKQYVTFNTDYNYAVRRDSGNLEAAKAFVEFMLDESGYALDQEFISIVRTDPYPEMYGDMENVIPIRNGVYEGGNHALYQTLIQSVDPTDAGEIRKIVKAAANPYESYDTVMQDWNRRWENGRPEGMTTIDRSTTRSASAAEESTQQNSSSHIVGIDNEAYRIMFSPTEMEYIKDKKKLRIGYLTNQAPFQYQAGTVDELLNPEFEGLSAMMCDVVTDSTGLEAEYVPYANEEELIQALEAGTLDMAAGVKTNAKYEGRVLFSKEYIEFVNVFLKNEDVDASRLEGGTQALIAGDSHDINAVAESESVPFSSIAEAVRSVNAHKADFAITNYYSAEYYIRNEECEHINVVPLTGKTKMGFAYANDVDSRLVAICNKCIYSLSEDSIQMMLLQNMDPASKPVTLKRFIKENPFTAAGVGALIVLLVAGAVIVIKREREKSRKKHALDARRYEILSHLTDEYVFEYDLKEGEFRFEEKFERKFNFGQHIILKEYQYDHPALNILIENCDRAKENESTMTDAFELVDMDGGKQWYNMIAYRIAGEDGQPSYLIGKIVNVQQAVEEKQRIQEKADKDPLTGIYNRTGYEARFQELSDRYGKDASMTFAVMDLDNFKAVNDSLGHAGGDEALKLLAGRLDRISGESAVAARYGGDEFMVCMFGVGEEDARKIFRELVDAMDTDIRIQGVVHHLSISLGAVHALHALPSAVLFMEADKVLYNVKAKGKNGFDLILHEEAEG